MVNKYKMERILPYTSLKPLVNKIQEIPSQNLTMAGICQTIMYLKLQWISEKILSFCAYFSFLTKDIKTSR